MSRLFKKLRLVWNWFQGKRIVMTDPRRGRVMIRTGRNSATRSTGGQWYLQRYETAGGPPPLPRCVRGRLDAPEAVFSVERIFGSELDCARRWYERRHGPLAGGQELALVCVYDANGGEAGSRVMPYRPSEVFEIEHPWLGSDYSGPQFTSYFGTWYGRGRLDDGRIMDWEIFWNVGPESRPLPRLGSSWR